MLATESPGTCWQSCGGLGLTLHALTPFGILPEVMNATPPSAHLPASKILPSFRHAIGRSNLASALNHWMAQCEGMSHQQVTGIADWSLGELGWLSSPQFSNLRNGKILKPSLRYLEAVAAVNIAIWRWHVKGRQACLDAYGPFADHGIDPAVLDAATWIPHPEHPDEPLCLADVVELAAGYLTLPWVSVTLTVSQAQFLSEQLSALLDTEIGRHGWGIREGEAQVLAAYPTTDQLRRERLQQLLLGTAKLSAEEIEGELFDLALLISSLRGLPDGTFGPSELYAELIAERRRG